MNQSRPSVVHQTSNPIADNLQTKRQQKQQAERELVEAIGNSRDVLVRATTVFPITLFPDTIAVDRTKLTVTHRDFLRSGEVLSISIEDILNVTAQVGPIFGSVKISTRFFDNTKPYEVDHFWRSDALKIKRIVQGYLIAKQQEVDCSSLSTPELAKMLDRLGKVDKQEKL